MSDFIFVLGSLAALLFAHMLGFQQGLANGRKIAKLEARRAGIDDKQCLKR